MTTTNPNTIAYCVDTNLLIEFAALESVAWNSIAPTAEAIRIIIPTKVGEEMDEHKNKSGRLRRRAIEFSQLSRRMESSADGVVILRNNDPQVTVEFGPLFRKSDLDADRFDLDDSDNRVVAEVVAIARNVPGVVLLADDSKPIRLARQVGLPYVRPPNEWRRQDGPDERDAEIAELKREIGARPVLTVQIADVVAGGRIVIEDSPDSAEPACVKAFAEAVVESEPKTSREELIKRHGIDSPARFDLSRMFRSGLTYSQLDRYDEQYSAFTKNAEDFSEVIHKVLSQYGFSRCIEIDVGNDGDRAGEKVVVEARVTGSFRFLPTDGISNQLASVLSAPPEPKPQRDMLAPYSDLDLSTWRAPARPDVFHNLEGSRKDEPSTYASWRCEELRQGAHLGISVLVVSERPGEKGLMEVTVSSAVLAKKTTMRYPLETLAMRHPAGRSYFLQRLKHIPGVYRDSFRAKLEVG